MFIRIAPKLLFVYLLAVSRWNQPVQHDDVVRKLSFISRKYVVIHNFIPAMFSSSSAGQRTCYNNYNYKQNSHSRGITENGMVAFQINTLIVHGRNNYIGEIIIIR